MFSGVMLNAWEVATVVAVVAGVVGVFVVLRGAAFSAHAVPMSAFAGAAGASLLGVDQVLGLGVFSLAGAVGIGVLGRRGRHDVATALALVLMLALGSLFLSWSTEYAPEIYSLLFGEVLGVSTNQIGVTALLGGLALIAVAVLYRPLLLTSVAPEVAAARGIRVGLVDLAFLVVVALATTMSVPVVGVLLMFTLMVGPPAAARWLSRSPGRTMVLSVALALVTVWASIAASYSTNWPIGFFVGAIGAGLYVVARGLVLLRRRRPGGVDRAGPGTAPGDRVAGLPAVAPRDALADLM